MPEYFVIDGAMSTALEEAGYRTLNQKLWTAKALIDAPNLVKKVHRDYFEAGADCGITDSYQASIAGLCAAGYSEREAEQLIILSVQLFRQARDDWWKTAPDNRSYPLCLGSAGPYGACLADGSEYRGHYQISDSQLKAFHKRRVELLHQAGADIILFETVPSLKEALIEADLAEAIGADYWISFSCRDDHHTNEGQSIAECVDALKNHPHLKAIGVNCTHPRYITSLILDFKEAGLPIVVYPNSGEIYDVQTKQWSGEKDQIDFQAYALRWYKAGANGIGGCCSTTVRQIRDIRKARDTFLKIKKQIKVK